MHNCTIERTIHIVHCTCTVCNDSLTIVHNYSVRIQPQIPSSFLACVDIVSSVTCLGLYAAYSLTIVHNYSVRIQLTNAFVHYGGVCLSCL